MFRPAGFNIGSEAFDMANKGRIDYTDMTARSAAIDSALIQSGIEQEYNLRSKGLKGLASGLKLLDDARTNAKEQGNASQAGLVSDFGNALGGLAGGVAAKYGNSLGGLGRGSELGTQWDNAADRGAIGIGLSSFQNPYG